MRVGSGAAVLGMVLAAAVWGAEWERALVEELLRLPAPDPESLGLPRGDADWRQPASAEEALAMCERDPERLRDWEIRGRLPETPETVERVAALARSSEKLFGDEGIQTWLVLHDPDRVEELARRAAGVRETDDGRVEGSGYLEALALRHWERAEPLLQELSSRGTPAVATEAACLLYERAPSPEDRRWLQERASDPSWPLSARSRATSAIMRDRWEGQDQWFEELFVGTARDQRAPAADVLGVDPDRWTPYLLRLVESTDRSIRDAGVRGLCTVLYETILEPEPRPEAIRPLLPWLADPSWSACDPDCRGRVLRRAVDAGIVEEALPGIAAIVARGTDATDVYEAASGALKSLAGAPAAIPALLLLLERADGAEADSIRRALRASGHGLREELAVVVSGMCEGAVPASDVASVVTRARAARLLAPDLVEPLLGRGGFAEGFAVALLDDAHEASRILEAGGSDARATLLACARLRRGVLPLAQVVPLLDAEDPLVAWAADAYLEAEDSKEARRAILARHPGEARILGVRARSGRESEVFDRAEEALRREVLGTPGPEEVVALLSSSFYGGGKDVVVRAWSDRATLTVSDDPARFKIRWLAPREWASLKAMLGRLHVDDLPPIASWSFHGPDYRYLHFGRDGGRRLWMDRPEVHPAGRDHFAVVAAIQGLAESGGYEHRYVLDDRIPGARVLLADPERLVMAVWARGDDLRVEVTSGPDLRRPGEISWHRVSDGGVGAAAPAPHDLAVDGPEEGIATQDSALHPVAYLPRQCAFLVRREKDYFLLSPAAGNLEHVEGDFRPWESAGSSYGSKHAGVTVARPLQESAVHPGRAWAAIPSHGDVYDEELRDALIRGEEHTVVGLHDLRTFTFEPLITLPRVWFGSHWMWVDEESGRILIAHQGQLLMVPLPPGWQSTQSSAALHPPPPHVPAR